MQALADPIRRQILLLVRDTSLPAGAIASAFSVSRPAVSRHLRVLRDAGLVCGNVSGRERVYRLKLAPLAQVEAFVAELRVAHDAKRSVWEQRFMQLETEVYRVRARRKAAGPQPKDDRKRKTA